MAESSKDISIGFSPCPNDTFIFHAMMHDLVDCENVSFKQPVLEDVETLNNWALDAKLDVTKISFHALGHVLDDYVLLKSGSALGRGCGPLLVSSEKFAIEDISTKTVAIPGRHTTAAMLLRMFAPGCQNVVEMRFEEIMPSIVEGKVDAGVIIHESRFTYIQHGLVLLQDLGTWWEETSGYPIPLGGIASKRSLGADVITKVDRCIEKSIRMAFDNPDQSMPYIREHAQELDDKVIRDHISLYVNSFSERLGQEGEEAINAFLLRGREAGVLPDSNKSLFVDTLSK